MSIRSDTARTAALLAIILTGLALRIAASRGDFWLDEAWSALLAREAATPDRVFFAINHDNNHFINTLWLQLVGWSSPPLLGRALSICCGTAAIPIAWLIGARRNARAGLIAALLFAVSPILVTYGSEARGYAPMLLALLTSLWIVDRELNGIPVRHAPIWLGLVALVGTLAHLSMLVGLAAISLWVLAQHWRKAGFRPAVSISLHLMGRALAAAIAVLILIAIAASASPDGFTMGSRIGFGWSDYVGALAQMVGFTVGWPFEPGIWLIAPLLIPAVLAVRGRAIFYVIAITALPAAVAIIQPDNSAFPRYHLVSAVALLLLLADLLSAKRWALILVAAIIAGSLVVDLRIITNLRAQPGVAIVAMRSLVPKGTKVLIDEPRNEAVLAAAAGRQRYNLAITSRCSPGIRFLFTDEDATAPKSTSLRRCGAAFRSIAARHHYGLSGMDWRLYERIR